MTLIKPMISRFGGEGLNLILNLFRIIVSIEKRAIECTSEVKTQVQRERRMFFLSLICITKT